MASDLLVSVPEYWANPIKPRNFQDFCDMYDARDHGSLGLWEIKRFNRDGKILSRLWLKNVITDNGATSMLKNTFNNAGSAVSIFNQIAITTNAGSTTLTTAIAANQAGVTSLAVAALPASIASGTTITLGFGGAAPQNVTTSALASSGATSISVTSFTANSTGFPIGSNVVPVPTTSDNPSSLGGTVAYSGALPGGDFTFSGTGLGNRQVVIVFTFAAGSTTGNFTEAWLVNTNPVSGVGQTAVHAIFVAQPVNSGAGATITMTEKV